MHGSCAGWQRRPALTRLSGSPIDVRTPPGMRFISTRGLEFREGTTRHTFVGCNFWAAMNLAAPGPSGDRARLGRELDRLQALGVTNVRVLASSEGPATEPFRMVPPLLRQPGDYDEDVFAGLDMLLFMMKLRGMRAVMVLGNFWEWSGGFGQFVQWATGEPIPYASPHQEWDAYQRYAQRFYSLPACQKWYRDHILAVVSRKNTQNGVEYRDDPTIFSWELANEPRGHPKDWPDEVAGYIKSLDRNHLVTTGSEGSFVADFVATHKSPDIDYATTHIWVENWGKYDPCLATADGLEHATRFALTYLAGEADLATSLGKPLVLEEFGLARDGFTDHGKLAVRAPVSHRDRYFSSLYQFVEHSALSGALQGDNFWAWAGEARPPSRWTGDPPHEPPGWYSVYDCDATTLDLVAAHAAAMRRRAQAAT